jgi:hypothetical protein
MWSVSRSYVEDIRGDQVSYQEFCTAGCEDKKSSLLEAVARERLVKTHQAEIRPSVCCSDL